MYFVGINMVTGIVSDSYNHPNRLLGVVGVCVKRI